MKLPPLSKNLPSRRLLCRSTAVVNKEILGSSGGEFHGGLAAVGIDSGPGPIDECEIKHVRRFRELRILVISQRHPRGHFQVECGDKVRIRLISHHIQA